MPKKQGWTLILRKRIAKKEKDVWEWPWGFYPTYREAKNEQDADFENTYKVVPAVLSWGEE